MDDQLKCFFGKIIQNNTRRIWRICRAYAYNNEDQKDLYQDVALNIWKSLPSFRRNAAIDTWVFRICLNVCMKYSMKLKKAKQVFADIDAIQIADIKDPQSEFENLEKTKILYACISTLEWSDKSLILLFLEDLSYKTIAEVTGITENHVAVKLSRIKKKLFNCVNQ